MRKICQANETGGLDAVVDISIWMINIQLRAVLLSNSGLKLLLQNVNGLLYPWKRNAERNIKEKKNNIEFAVLSFLWKVWSLKVGMRDRPETSITTNQHCVTSRKREDLISTAMEVRNLASPCNFSRRWVRYKECLK